MNLTTVEARVLNTPEYETERRSGADRLTLVRNLAECTFHGLRRLQAYSMAGMDKRRAFSSDLARGKLIDSCPFPSRWRCCAPCTWGCCAGGATRRPPPPRPRPTWTPCGSGSQRRICRRSSSTRRRCSSGIPGCRGAPGRAVPRGLLRRGQEHRLDGFPDLQLPAA